MLETRISAAVQVICDLRSYRPNIDSERKMDELWRSINDRLVGKELRNGGQLEVYLDRGKLVRLWVVDAHDQARVTPDTSFHIVDIVRNPWLIYHCRICGKYGPFRCMDCVKAERPRGEERLCLEHANFIEGRWSAYCDEHMHHCHCSSLCKDIATFCCEHCNRFYGEHYRTSHPHDKTIDYCQKCYDRLFGHCSVCEKEGKHDSLGTLHCSFKSRNMAYPCGIALCWKHAWQWKIWGPHNHGITLCEHHKRLLRNSEPADVITMMITTRPPRSRRGKSFSLANLYRLRRLLNRDRAEPLSFEQIVQTLHALSAQSITWDKYTQQRYSAIVRVCEEIMRKLPDIQRELLAKIREYYWNTVGRKAAQSIVWLSIEDRWISSDQPDLLIIAVHLNTASKRPYIGLGGETVKRIEAQLGARLEFWDVTVTPPKRID
jgi:hypothetical protein